MSAPNQGRQSPPPEEQSGAQQQDAPSDGQGVNTKTNNLEENKKQLEVCVSFLANPRSGVNVLGGVDIILDKILTSQQGLASNPKGPLDDHVKEVASKTVDK